MTQYLWLVGAVTFLIPWLGLGYCLLKSKRKDREILLDDWSGSHCDAWDYEAVLREHGVSVGQESYEDSYGNCSFGYYWFSWKHGTGTLRTTNRIIARKCAALYVSLWLLGVSASFANKLQQGYTLFLQMQEDARR
jgi:hypothetical protein